MFRAPSPRQRCLCRCAEESARARAERRAMLAALLRARTHYHDGLSPRHLLADIFITRSEVFLPADDCRQCRPAAPRHDTPPRAIPLSFEIIPRFATTDDSRQTDILADARLKQRILPVYNWACLYSSSVVYAKGACPLE